MGQLYFLIGLARSGKSTFAKNWSVYNNNFNSNFNLNSNKVVLSLDSFRLAASGKRYNGYTESSVFLSSSLAAKALLLDGYDVLIDDTHTSEESIKRVFRIATNAIHYRLDVSTEVCVQRAVECGQADLQWVIERQAKNLEKLTNEKIEEIRQSVINDRSANYITQD